MLRKIWFVTVGFLSIGVALYAIFLYLVIGADNSPFVEGKTEDIKTTGWYVALVIHAGLSAIALILIPFMFSKKLLQKRKMLHRSLGKVYVISVLIGALSGLYLAYYSDGGLSGKLGFIALSVLWLVTTIMAFYFIRYQKNIRKHRKWMIRSASLTAAAITLRLWLPIFAIAWGLDYPEAVVWVAWLCWVPNLFIAELFLRYRPSIPIEKTVAK